MTDSTRPSVRDAGLRRIDNLDLIASDFEKLVAFYRDTLGLPFAINGYRPEKGWAMYSCGNVNVVILSVPGAAAPPRRTSAYWSNPAGLDSLAFQVENIDATIERLTHAGVDWAGELVIYGNGKVLSEAPTADFDGIWYRYRSFYDTEGGMLHLTEPHFPKSHPGPTGGEGDPALELMRVDNLDIVVRNYEPMVAFYRDVLGWEFAASGYQPEKGWAMFACGNIDVVLLSVPDASRGARRTAEYKSNPAGFDSLAFEVADLDQGIAALDAADMEWAADVVIEGNGEVLDGPPGEAFEGIWYRFRSFYDPEGNLLHLTEPHFITS